jgi:hypothetical protein
MAILESLNFASVSPAEWLKVIFILVIGIVLGAGIKYLIIKTAKVIFYPWIRKSSPGSYKRAVSGVNLISRIIQWGIIILFVFQALSVFQIFLLQEIIRLSLSFLPKMAISVLIIIVGLIISSIISRKISDLEFKNSELLAKIFSIFFISATILSALEVVDVKVTAFLYLFIAALLSVVLAIAIAIGIAFGIALRPEISKLLSNLKK